MEMNQAGDIHWQSNEDLKEILVVGGVIVHFPQPPPGVSRKTNGGSWPVNVNHSMNPSPVLILPGPLLFPGRKKIGFLGGKVCSPQVRPGSQSQGWLELGRGGERAADAADGEPQNQPVWSQKPEACE